MPTPDDLRIRPDGGSGTVGLTDLAIGSPRLGTARRVLSPAGSGP